MHDYILGVVTGLLIGIICTLLICMDVYYRRGQIDCINGAVYYKLEKQIDGAIKWEKSTKIVK